MARLFHLGKLVLPPKFSVHIQLHIHLDQHRLAVLHCRAEPVLPHGGDNLLVLGRVSALQHADVRRDAIVSTHKLTISPASMCVSPGIFTT